MAFLAPIGVAIAEAASAVGSAVASGAGAIGSALGVGGAAAETAGLTAAQLGSIAAVDAAGGEIAGMIPAVTAPAATAGGGFPWLSAVSTAGSLFSGIGGKLQAASTANAQADMYTREAKLKEQREIQRGQALLAKEHANAAASGLSASSGSPLATTMGSTDDLRTNAAAAGYPGRMEAFSRRMEANNSYAQIPGMLSDALSSRAGQSVLGYLIDRRRY